MKWIFAVLALFAFDAIGATYPEVHHWYSEPVVDINLVFSACLIVLGFMQWRVYDRQRKIMDQQRVTMEEQRVIMVSTLKTTEQNTETARLQALVGIGVQLPRLVIKTLEIDFSSKLAVKSDPTTAGFDEFLVPRVTVWLKNYGQTIAFVEDTRLEVLVAYTPPDQPDYPMPKEHIQGLVIETQKTHPLEHHRTQIESSVFNKEILAHKTWVYIYGLVEYRDFLDNRSIVRFGKRVDFTGEKDPKRYAFVDILNPAYTKCEYNIPPNEQMFMT